ncbi:MULTISPECIES: LysM peptidoglycan-binding domain-containing protein [unclassified Pseudoalteromonas]|uniref:LysM peptidoglycan-binding domain-containing protein n=1 Tax=unclassified Pseudoalteromonas TaxID=194690 RepID=UPI000CF65EC7|nr:MULTISPECIES: LysM domain-containing protein [unclassified Pseudoalteromonas]MBS3796976.1 LysM peptidoglycan-binding domain-containing protein [Pseudoalteromonas sp. BDTF-M6]
MIKQLSAAVFALAVAFPSLADVLAVKDDAPEQYVVKKGDTLWDISAIYLDKPWLWPELWQMNPQIDNPHLIYPGDTLYLVYDAQGRPRLVVKRPDNYQKLSPHGRKTMKRDALPTLSLELLRPFLTYDQALSEEKINAQPYVLGANENVKRSTQGHILYVKGDLERNRSYAIYHKNRPYIDPQTEELLGYEVKLVATAKAFRSGDVNAGVPASIFVDGVKREINAGDFLMPVSQGQSLPATFQMRRPETEIDGEIIASSNQLREFSKMDIVVLNRGMVDEVKAGHMFDIRRQSPTVIDGRDGPQYKEDSSTYDKFMSNMEEGMGMEEDADNKTWHMPKEKVGELMVLKVQERVSYAIITKTLRPIRVGDVVSVD